MINQRWQFLAILYIKSWLMCWWHTDVHRCHALRFTCQVWTVLLQISKQCRIHPCWYSHPVWSYVLSLWSSSTNHHPTTQPSSLSCFHPAPHFSTHPFPRDLSHYCHSHCSSLGHSPVCQSWWHRASPPSLCVVTATCLCRHCRWCQDAPSRRSPSSISLFLCPLHRLHGMLFCSVRQKSFDSIPGNVKALLENTQLSVRWLMQKASDHTQSNSW